MLPRLESALLSPVGVYLRRRGYRHQRAEMQFFERRIDLYAFCEKRDVTLSVELKLRKWRRALRQALLYQLCSDLVFIAVPKAAVRAIDLDLLRLDGVGLLAVRETGTCQEVLASDYSRVVRKRYREAYIELLRGVR